jgi:hypothetical protein
MELSPPPPAFHAALQKLRRRNDFYALAIFGREVDCIARHQVVCFTRITDFEKRLVAGIW